MKSTSSPLTPEQRAEAEQLDAEITRGTALIEERNATQRESDDLAREVEALTCTLAMRTAERDEARAEVEHVRALLKATEHESGQEPLAWRERNRVRLQRDEWMSIAAKHKAEIERLTARVAEAERTVRSIATMLGWENVPPRESIEANLNALRRRLEGSEARVAELEQTASLDEEALNHYRDHASACQKDALQARINELEAGIREIGKCGTCEGTRISVRQYTPCVACANGLKPWAASLLEGK